MSSTLTTLPKAAVSSYLRLLRFPVDAAGKLTRHDDTWPPALAFDRFEAQVLGLLGSMLHDDDLVLEAKRQQVRVDQLRRAVTLEATAAERRAAADDELDERRTGAKEQVKEAQQRKERAAARLDETKTAAQRKARQDATAKEEKARKAAEARKNRLKSRQRDAETKRLAAERNALVERHGALEMSDSARALDQAATAVKQRRQSRN